MDDGRALVGPPPCHGMRCRRRRRGRHLGSVGAGVVVRGGCRGHRGAGGHRRCRLLRGLGGSHLRAGPSVGRGALAPGDPGAPGGVRRADPGVAHRDHPRRRAGAGGGQRQDRLGAARRRRRAGVATGARHRRRSRGPHRDPGIAGGCRRPGDRAHGRAQRRCAPLRAGGPLARRRLAAVDVGSGGRPAGGRLRQPLGQPVGGPRRPTGGHRYGELLRGGVVGSLRRGHRGHRPRHR